MILFVLFGGSVGAVVFLHTQYGWQAVLQVKSLSRTWVSSMWPITPAPAIFCSLCGPFLDILPMSPCQVLDQELTRSVLKYRPENKLTTQFWDWAQVSTGRGMKS